MTKESFKKAMELVKVINCLDDKKVTIYERIHSVLYTPSSLTSTMRDLLKQQVFEAIEPIFNELAKKLEQEFENI